MTSKLAKLVKDTALTIVKRNEDCIFTNSRVKATELALIEFAEKLEAELTPPPVPPIVTA